MEKISINDLPKIKNELKGYRLTYNQEGIVKFVSSNDIKEYELEDYITINEKLYMPNYDNCILNIDASLCKYYGIEPKYKTFTELDSVLEGKKYKHIAIMLLDGLGSYILRNNLLDNSFRYAKNVIEITSTDDFVKIYNDGPNISDEILEKIYKPYEKSTDGKFGLGMSIVKRTFDMFNIKMEINNLEIGVEFIIYKNDISVN